MLTSLSILFSPGRVDNVYGDRNLTCTLLSPSQAEEEQKAAAATA